MRVNGSGGRVLVVEDEMLLAMLLQTTLQEAGYEVVGPVARLDRALQAALEEDISAALLDINLDGEMVYPVAEVLAQRGIPFAFVTGYDRESLPAHHGAAAILHKPFRAAPLLDMLAGMNGKRPRSD